MVLKNAEELHELNPGTQPVLPHAFGRARDKNAQPRSSTKQVGPSLHFQRSFWKVGTVQININYCSILTYFLHSAYHPH